MPHSSSVIAIYEYFPSKKLTVSVIWKEILSKETRFRGKVEVFMAVNVDIWTEEG
jgi:hypothetical protein